MSTAVLTAVVLAVPTLSWATGAGAVSPSGGTSASGIPGSGTQSSGQPSARGQVSASGDGINLLANAATLLRNQLSFSGTAPSSDAGKTIVIERMGKQTGWQWAQTATATVGGDGSFDAVWKANHIGRFSIRALISQGTSAGAASAAPTVTITVFRSSLATLYGPGLYGHRTACGEKLARTTIGVANRTLRCGTKVAVLYHGRTLVVPVIDHGPYANGANWDLTMATGRALRMTGTSRIGAVSVPKQPSAAALARHR
jgi:rare lipoprotein A (peptidoglycan hydrolase)